MWLFMGNVNTSFVDGFCDCDDHPLGNESMYREAEIHNFSDRVFISPNHLRTDWNAYPKRKLVN